MKELIKNKINQAIMILSRKQSKLSTENIYNIIKEDELCKDVTVEDIDNYTSSTEFELYPDEYNSTSKIEENKEDIESDSEESWEERSWEEFPFDDQEYKNFIIYGVDVPYKSGDEGDDIWNNVRKNLDMIRVGGDGFRFGYIVVGFKLLEHCMYKIGPSEFDIPKQEQLREYDKKIAKYYPNLKPKMYFFPTANIN